MQGERTRVSVVPRAEETCGHDKREVLDTFVLVKIEPSQPAKDASKNKDSKSQKAPLNATS